MSPPEERVEVLTHHEAKRSQHTEAAVLELALAVELELALRQVLGLAEAQRVPEAQRLRDTRQLLRVRNAIELLRFLLAHHRESSDFVFRRSNCVQLNGDHLLSELVCDG